MSVESDAFNEAIGNLKRERDQIIPFITDLQTRLATALTDLANALAAGATDKEIADAARAAMPDIAQVVADMDQFTPEGTPVVEPTV